MSQHRGISHPQTDYITTASGNLFQSLHDTEQLDSVTKPLKYDTRLSFLTSALNHDNASLRESFQRIKIAGDFEDCSHIEDLDDSITLLPRALVTSEKYFFFFKFDKN